MIIKKVCFYHVSYIECTGTLDTSYFAPIVMVYNIVLQMSCSKQSLKIDQNWASDELDIILFIDSLTVQLSKNSRMATNFTVENIQKIEIKGQLNLLTKKRLYSNRPISKLLDIRKDFRNTALLIPECLILLKAIQISISCLRCRGHAVRFPQM